MMSKKRNWLGPALLALLMGVTAFLLLKGQPLSLLWASLKRLRAPFVLLGLGMMLGYVGCEALCTRQILGRLGHRVPYLRCLGYSLVGFYVSSVTPSATGGQPAQVYYMSRDQIPAAHGALNMMLIAACYQTATLLWGGGVWIFLPQVRDAMGGGLGLLLLYGMAVMVLLTLGMGLVMFLPSPARRVCGGVLSLLTAAIMLVLLLLLLRRIVRHPLGRTACVLLLAGGCGNLIDRLRLGYVVDMFNFQFISYPVFNVADIAVVAGMILGAAYYLFLYEKHDALGRGADHGDSAPRR